MSGRSPLAAFIVVFALLACAPAAVAQETLEPILGGPTVEITAPLEGAVLQHGQVIPIEATASGDVPVASVKFYADDVLIDTDTTASDGVYSVDYPVPASEAGQSQQIKAVATDTGFPAQSAEDKITVQIADNAPTVTLTDPGEAQVIPHSQARALQATAFDDVGVKSVAFYVDDVSVGTDETASSGVYSVPYEPPATKAGQSQVIKAVATDTAATPQSAEDTNTVRIADNAPQVGFESPTDGATIPYNATTKVTVTVSDERPIQGVQFHRGPEPLGPGTHLGGSKYTVDYTPAAAHAGSGQALVATAVDDAGQDTTVAIGVRVSSPPVAPPRDDRPPTVAFTSPAAGALVDPRLVPPLRANASDDKGVTRVTFYDDGDFVCADTAAPFGCPYSPTGDDVGRNTLIAVAQDRLGQTSAAFRQVNLAKFTPTLTSRATPRRDRKRPYRYRVSGKLSMPPGVTEGQGCGRGGSVQVEFATGRLQLPMSAPLAADCTFKTSIAFPSKRPLGRRGRLTVTTFFAGNEVLGTATGPKHRLRAG